MNYISIPDDLPNGVKLYRTADDAPLFGQTSFDYFNNGQTISFTRQTFYIIEQQRLYGFCESYGFTTGWGILRDYAKDEWADEIGLSP